MDIQERINQVRCQKNKAIKRENAVKKQYSDKLVEREEARAEMDKAWEERVCKAKIRDDEQKILLEASNHYQEVWDDYQKKVDEIFSKIRQLEQEICREDQAVTELLREGFSFDADEVREHRDVRSDLYFRKEMLYQQKDELKQKADDEAGRPNSDKYRAAKAEAKAAKERHLALRDEYLKLKDEAKNLRLKLEKCKDKHARLGMILQQLYRERNDYIT